MAESGSEHDAFFLDVWGVGERGIRNPVYLGAVATACLIALLAIDRMALAQVGSIGGTIGKTDKSASGGEDLQSAIGNRDPRNSAGKTAPKRSSGGCERIIGVWTWRISIFSFRIVVTPNGVATHSITMALAARGRAKAMT
jgi:hypothetical protein